MSLDQSEEKCYIFLKAILYNLQKGKMRWKQQKFHFFISTLGIWLSHGQSGRCPPKNKLNFKIIIQNNFEPFFTTLGKSSINRLNKI